MARGKLKIREVISNERVLGREGAGPLLSGDIRSLR